MKIWSFVGGVCLALSIAVFAQEALTNDSIEKMAKAGLGDDVIISMIHTHPGQYDVTPDTLIALKGDGISNSVLAAMVAKGSNVIQPTSPTTPAAGTDPYGDLDLGVYRRVRDAWIPIPSELVNWKTGGVVKNVVSAGIVKGDVNGHIRGGSSTTQVNTPLVFLIKTPDGVEATEYQLVHLHAKEDSREFRTVTGGVFHASGGSTRDRLDFVAAKVGRHTYAVTLSDALQPGEYAFLAPGLTNSSSSGSTGKAYTFRLVE